ncbi:MAG: lytic murein transglycosylase [Cytophagaceae bacterium]|nr:lytic murein transglycosylase [Gemmatimonadaceae bacterium]
MSPVRIRAALAIPLLALGTRVDAQGAFEACLASVQGSAAARRVLPDTWEQHLTGVRPDSQVLAALDAQPEFRLPIWDYVAIMADQQRVDDGRARMDTLQPALDSISRRYGVDREVLVAIWGIESDFGRGQGSYRVVRSLATLSCMGRRQAYFRRELLAALRILQAGHVAPEAFLGSWAGAFGQTQFMPGTFEWLAVDHDGDGRRDVIGSTPDALASTANYLRNAGWKRAVPWGFEVRIPAGMTARGEGRRVKRTLATWTGRGVRRADGSPLVTTGTPASLTAGLLLPAGPEGPAFLVTRTFDALYRYNASESYSLAVAHVSDRLRGAPGLVTSWPTDDPGLSRADRRELQALLRQRGHDVGAPTAVYTSAIRAAVKLEQERLGMPPSGRAGQRLLTALRAP